MTDHGSGHEHVGERDEREAGSDEREDERSLDDGHDRADDEQDAGDQHEDVEVVVGDDTGSEKVHESTVPTYAVAYLRVSTQEQALHGSGLATQRDYINGWARKHHRKIIGWHIDEGKSGGLKLSGRRSLVNAIDQAQLEQAELVVYRLDRLARDLIVQEQCLDELTRVGSRLRSVDDTEDRMLVDPLTVDDTDAHTRVLMRQIIGAIGQWERSMIAMRMRAGRKSAERAGYQMGGWVPYGWRRAVGPVEHGMKRRWEPDPGHRWHIAGWIVEARLGGAQWAAIARALTDHGIEPPSGGDNVWSINAVKRIYMGVRRMGQRGYATPGPPLPGAASPEWGLTGGGSSSSSASVTPAAR